MLKIVTDGSVDMPECWEQEYDISIVPIPIQFGERTFLQGIDLKSADFYKMVRETGVIPKTSLPSVGQLVQFYRRIAEPGDTILSIHVSSKMSGTFSAAVSAARELAGRYKVIPFDSWSGSAALGFMCRDARLLERAGSSLQEIQDRLDYVRRNVRIVLALDNLEFARKSGRVGAMKAAWASMLNLKPIVVLREGILNMGDRARTRSRSIDRVLDMLRQNVGEQLVNVAVVHSCDPEAGLTMMERVQSLFHCKDVVMTELSISVAANLGPGTVGLVVYPAE